jgi:hypothetical protein
MWGMRSAVGLAIAILATALAIFAQVTELMARTEFRFVRMEYLDVRGAGRGFGRGWWRQDWPEAEMHFAQGIRRLTRIDTGEGHHLPLTDDRVFEYPWMYATQTGYWDLSDAEARRLGDYLRRGGFLVVDDFYGPAEWEVFRESMQRALPGHSIEAIADDDPIWHVLYDINERFFIAGLRHLGIGRGGGFYMGRQGLDPPEWKAIRDDKGRIVVAINFSMDVGDAWEHADLAEYPEQMTGLAYRLGINYIIYSMTH